MSEASRHGGIGGKLVAPVMVIVVVAVAAHLWWNTNLLGRDDVCDGLVSAESAEGVFSQAGRVSDRDGLDEQADDRLAFACVVETSSFLPGADDEYLRIVGTRERGDFPFTDGGRWPSPVRMSFFSGGATGAIGANHSWVLLPDACTTAKGPAIIEGYVPEGSDPVRVARLLTGIADRAAERADCAGERPLTAPDALAAVPEPRPVEGGAVCGLAGLDFPGPEGSSGVRETVQDRAEAVWSCEVERYATYVVTQEPRIVAGIRSSPGYERQPAVAGHQVSGFDARHVVADCAGTPTYFALEVGHDYLTALEGSDAPRTEDLFENFVDVAGARFGCTAP